MQVSFYPNFSKRPNSTEQPPQALAVSVQCQLKDETSFMRPTLKIVSQLSVGTFAPGAFTYAYIPAWQRYYYVQDWNYINACWECVLMVDVLASFKTEIGLTSAYVIRAAAAYDGSIIDTMYPANTNYDIVKTNVATSWYNVAPSGGTYIIGVINNQATGRTGSVAYYALNQNQLNSLLAYLFSDSIYNGASITEISSGLYKSLFDPFQYIVSCIWFPFGINSFGSTQTTMKVGYWDTGVQGIICSSTAQNTFVTATIPNHPQASRGSYLNYAPYTKHTLYLPPFGSIPIDTNFKRIGNYLYSAVYVDHLTGQATLRVSICPSSSSLSEYNVMTERTANMGVPIQIAQIMVDAVSGVQSVIGGISSVIAGAIGGIFASVGNALESQMPKVSTSGANGSFLNQIIYPVLVSEFLRVVSDDNTEFGRPLCQVRRINTLTGYIQCGEDDHQFSGTKAENEEINSYMKNGFFYE